MKFFTVTISDAGQQVNRVIQTADIEAACAVIERELGAAEEITEDNPDCEPRTEWACHILGDDYAECSLRTEGEQDSAAWAKVTIEAVTFEGWQKNGNPIETPAGINVYDYFRNGDYIGADLHGVEPVFGAK